MTSEKTAIKTLYLHGFLSSGNSQKGQWLLQANQQANYPLGELYCPTYSQQDLMASIKTLQGVLSEWQQQASVEGQTVKLLIIGSSLGGYLAQYFAHQFNCRYVMINPALNPIALFNDFLGTHINPYTGEQIDVDQVFCRQIAQLEVETPNAKLESLLLVDEDDEVVDIPFAVEKYQHLAKAKTLIYPQGNHAFSHMPEAWLEILKFNGDC